MNRSMSGWSVVSMAALIIGCSNQMQPAKEALGAAASAIQEAATDGAKYMPEHLKTLQDRMATLQSAYDQKNYDTVISSAPALTNDATTLAKEAAAKRAETDAQLASQWSQLSTAVPGIIEQVRSRAEALGKARRRPKEVQLSQAQSALAEASTLWQKAAAAHTSGDLAAAVTSAKDAQARAQAAAEALKLKLSTG